MSGYTGLLSLCCPAGSAIAVLNIVRNTDRTRDRTPVGRKAFASPGAPTLVRA